MRGYYNRVKLVVNLACFIQQERRGLGNGEGVVILGRNVFHFFREHKNLGKQG